MTSLRIKNGLLLTTAAASVLLLSACFGGQPQSQGTSPTTGFASPTSSSASPSASTPPSSSAPSTPPTSAAPAAALCKAGSLKARTDSTGGGAAGSVYMKLILTNSGGTPCLLKGFPGVSLTNGAEGAPIGMAAGRDESTPVVDVVLAPGQSGSAVLRYVQPGNIPSCSLAPAEGFRVYPPEDTASLFIAQEMMACLNADVGLLTVGTFQAG